MISRSIIIFFMEYVFYNVKLWNHNQTLFKFIQNIINMSCDSTGAASQPGKDERGQQGARHRTAAGDREEWQRRKELCARDAVSVVTLSGERVQH